jgi:DNA-binding MurR/RpiR family transcriptional regulator
VRAAVLLLWYPEGIMPLDDETLPERVRRREDLLSGSQRKIARYCITQAREASQLTALRIAEKLAVSESTVVRFAIRMGYQGFPDMQAAMRRAAAQRTATDAAGTISPRDARVHASLRGDLEALAQSVESFDYETLHECAEALHGARRLYVVGFRSSFGLAYTVELHLRHFMETRLIGAVGGTVLDDIDLIGPEDALLAFTFPVYDERSLQAVEGATAVGANSVVVTDSALAPIPIDPLVRMLMTRYETQTFFNSAVAPSAVANALVLRLIELAAKQDRGLERRLYDRFQRQRTP